MVPRHKKYIRCMVDVRNIIMPELWEGYRGYVGHPSYYGREGKQKI